MLRALKRALTRPRRLPGGSLPLWQLMVMFTLGWGLFIFLLGFAPEYSRVALSFGIGVFVATFVAFMIVGLGLWPDRTLLHWLMRAVIGRSWLLLVLAIGIRAWTALVPEWFWLWVALFGGMYLFAWAFPALYPRLSARLYREQLSPETPAGRGCLTVIWFLLPLGPSISMVLRKSGQLHLLWLFIGTAMTMASVGGDRPLRTSCGGSGPGRRRGLRLRGRAEPWKGCPSAGWWWRGRWGRC